MDVELALYDVTRSFALPPKLREQFATRGAYMKRLKVNSLLIIYFHSSTQTTECQALEAPRKR